MVRFTRWLIGLILLAAVLLLWMSSMRSSRSITGRAVRAADSPSRAGAPDRPVHAARTVEAQAQAAVPEPIAGTDVGDPGARKSAIAGIEQTIEIYRETMVYPLSSRPADGSNDYITHWNHPISVGQPFAVDMTKREIHASAQIDRVYAAPGQAISVLVTTRYAPPPPQGYGGDLIMTSINYDDRLCEGG